MRTSKYVALVALFMLTVISQNVKAQKKEPVSLSVVFGGGLAIPQSGLTGKVFGTSDKYPFEKNGYVLGAKLKLGFAETPEVRLVALGNYTSLSNDTSLTSIFNSKDTLVRVDRKLGITTVGVGVEYVFSTNSLIKPYLGVDATLNFLSLEGKTVVDPFAKKYKTEKAVRGGLALGGGVEIELPNSPVSFEIEGKYHFANLLGKKYQENNVLKDTYYLQDAKNPKDTKDNNRAINTIDVRVGLKIRLL